MKNNLGPPEPDWLCSNVDCQHGGEGSAPDVCPKCGCTTVLGLKFRDGPPQDKNGPFQIKRHE